METKNGLWPAFGALALVAAAGWFFFGGGFEGEVQRQTESVYSQVASDAVSQYGITERNGSAMDKCLAAQMVVAAFLQAKDEPNYVKWQSVQKAQCAAAGLPL